MQACIIYTSFEIYPEKKGRIFYQQMLFYLVKHFFKQKSKKKSDLNQKSIIELEKRTLKHINKCNLIHGFTEQSSEFFNPL